jgi:hypothetical protein
MLWGYVAGSGWLLRGDLYAARVAVQRQRLLAPVADQLSMVHG